MCRRRQQGRAAYRARRRTAGRALPRRRCCRRSEPDPRESCSSRYEIANSLETLLVYVHTVQGRRPESYPDRQNMRGPPPPPCNLPHAPRVTLNCRLRGLPTDAPLKNAPFIRYLRSNTLSTYSCGRTIARPTANEYPALALTMKFGSTWVCLLKSNRPRP